MTKAEQHFELAVAHIESAIEVTEKDGAKCFLEFVLKKMLDYQDTVGIYFDETRQTRDA